jgi:hypothetical protein
MNLFISWRTKASVNAHSVRQIVCQCAGGSEIVPLLDLEMEAFLCLIKKIRLISTNQGKQQFMVVTTGVWEKPQRTSIFWNTLSKLLDKFAKIPA